MTRNNTTHIEWIRKKIEESGTDVLRKLLLDTLQALMVDSRCAVPNRVRGAMNVQSRCSELHWSR